MEKELKDYIDRMLLNQTAIITSLSRLSEIEICKNILKNAFDETVEIMKKYNSI